MNELNFKDRFIIGIDPAFGKSQGAYIVYDKKQNRFRYLTTKKWKFKIGLFIARLLGWKVIM